MTLNAYLNRFRSVKVSPWPCSQCCEYSDENNYSLHGGKYLLKTPENAISETQKTQNVPTCLSPQELLPLVQVRKPSTIHHQPATRKHFDTPVDMFVRLDLHVQSQMIHVSVEIYCHVQIDQS